MRYVIYALFFLYAVSFSETADQTDWSGGDGVPGPVTDWGNSYDTSSQIDSTNGTLQLNTGPVEHIVDGTFDGAVSVYAADVDGDGDMDVLGAAYYADDITWWENTDGTGTVWVEHTVDGDFNGANSVCSADVDGDGDVDVLGAAYSEGFTWWENTDGTGTVWVEHTVDGDFNGARSVYVDDVDNDGDMDVLGAAFYADDISWWENTDGIGTVWVEHTVDGDFDGAHSVCAADVDGDGVLDVLGAACYADDITWWENTDGTGTIWVEHTIDIDFDGAYSVYATDVDGDGNMDVLGAGYDCNDITWWENSDTAPGIIWVEHTVDRDFSLAWSVYAADVDGDGDSDVLGAAYLADDITWWENTDGTGTVWVEHTVDEDFDDAISVYSADVDGDGNMDVLGAASADNDISWWNVMGYAEGTLESSILDAGLVDAWDVFASNSQEPTNTSVAFQFRSSSDAADMGTWSDTVYASSTGLSGILTDSTQYLQYRVILDTSDPPNTPVLEDVSFSYTVYLGIEENPASWALHSPENPSCGHYSAMITVPEPGVVELALYDVSGRVVAESSQEFPIGTHSVIFEGLAEGVYFCAMRAGDFSATEKVVVLE